MNWTHLPGPPGRRESWPPPPRTTPLSSIPCSAHFQRRRLPWFPTSQSCLAMGASPTPPPLPELFVNSLLAAPPGALAPPADSEVSSSGARWTTPSFFSPLSKSAKPLWPPATPLPTALTIWTSSTLNTWVPQTFPTSALSLTCPWPRRTSPPSGSRRSSLPYSKQANQPLWAPPIAPFLSSRPPLRY